MSAWDIAGAAVWSPLALILLIAIPNPGTNAQGKLICLALLLPIGLAAIFCIARLFGAHA